MAQAINIHITANFEHNLASIRCYLHQHYQADQYESLLDTLFDTIIPNLQSHPMIGCDFLAQTATSIEALKQVERIKARLPEGTSIRQYNDQDYLLLYSLHTTEIALLAIKHQQQMLFDLRGVDV